MVRNAIAAVMCLLISFSSGCATYRTSSVPGYVSYDQGDVGYGFEITQSRSVFSNKEVGLYTRIFIEMWRAEDFPQNRSAMINLINKIEINWQPNLFTFSNPKDGIQRLLGLAYCNLRTGRVRMYVSVAKGPVNFELDETAYGHELIHVALTAITGSAEVNHLQDASAIIWPPQYEDFLEKVSIRYQLTLSDNLAK